MFKALDDLLELLKLLFSVLYNFDSVLGQTVAIAMNGKDGKSYAIIQAYRKGSLPLGRYPHLRLDL